MSATTIILLVVIVIVVFVVGIYNSLVASRNKCDNAWATIDTQLQRRLDLIPNLMETVKGYAIHEQDTFTKVTQARNACLAASDPEEVSKANNQLSSTLHQLLAVAESYPDLKANQNFSQLQAELTDTENRISYARQSYNDCVYTYNTAIQKFPNNLLAGMFGFTAKPMYSTGENAKKAPRVQF